MRGILGAGHNLRFILFFGPPTAVVMTSASAVPPSEIQATIEQIWIYPVKSCGAMAMPEAELTDAGLAWDRAWMVKR